jgi:hypothetical protein
MSKVIQECWELRTDTGDCLYNSENYWDARKAYEAGARAINNGTFRLLHKIVTTDESDIVEALNRAGMV